MRSSRRSPRKASAPLVGSFGLWTASLALAACGSTEAEESATRAQLMDPETCKECHSTHYDEWAGSMHAYASEDPVFRAMNARGQEETEGKLGDFCVNCHAPLAVREGATTDGLNLDELPDELQGITCYFCHNIESVEGTHNNPIVLANDTVIRGPLSDAVPNSVHRSEYDPHLDSNRRESAVACGSCHDIVLPSPPAPEAVELERTFAEWQETLFDPIASCATCHMGSSNGSGIVADAPGVITRPGYPHSHAFPAIDVALTPFPGASRQRELILRELQTTLRVAELCVSDFGGIVLQLENAAAGHHFPSGAAQDRRVWIELIAYSGTDIVFESGRVPDGTPVVDFADSNLWLFRDRTFGRDGEPVHMFWDVARVEREAIPGPVTGERTDPEFFKTHVSRKYPNEGTLDGRPIDRVTVRARVRPMGLDVLDDLIESRHLDPAVRDAMPTFDFLPKPEVRSVTFEWTLEAARDPAEGSSTDVNGFPALCLGTR